MAVFINPQQQQQQQQQPTAVLTTHQISSPQQLAIPSTQSTEPAAPLDFMNDLDRRPVLPPISAFANPNPNPPPPAPADDDDTPPELGHITQRGIPPPVGFPPPSSEHPSDDDDEDDSEDEEQDLRRHRWRPLVECKDEPSSDELAHIESKEEHSAEDAEYWERQTFFDVDDLEVKSGESGRIQITVKYNGTKENPNKEQVMLSDTKRIGGYDWRIRFYPRGDNSSYLSCYVECVTMRAPDFLESADFPTLPFPQLKGENRELKKRQSIAAQVGVIMYNPAEPRVHEFQSDAHQYHKQAADYGWQKFSYEYHDNFHIRRFGQRTAILRDDTLAFTAYIRIIEDPTGCMWEHNGKSGRQMLYNNSLVTTGLRPFGSQAAQFPAIAALLHIPQFRKLLYRTKSDCRAVYLLQTFLMKMMSRKCSASYGNVQYGETGDVVSCLQWFAQKLIHGCDEKEAESMKSVIGTLKAEDGYAVNGNRLKTKGCRSVKEALRGHPTPITSRTLLTLELQRQEFDRKNRKWRKLTNRVEMDENVTVADLPYSLYAFVTHTGGLTSNRHTFYVRPGGIGTPWYAYQDGRVVAFTHRRAAEAHSGVEGRKDSVKSSRSNSPFRGVPDLPKDEVAYVVFYLASDTKENFECLREEEWLGIPDAVKNFLPFPGHDKEEQVEEKDRSSSPEHRARPSDSLATSGSSTPQWRMDDDDDVIMSDAEDDISPQPQLEPLAASTYLASTAAPNGKISPKLWTTTVDVLGQDYYAGQKLGDARSGSGHLITMSGDEYTGTFLANMPHGHGRMVYAGSGNIYDGDWVAGEHHGQGTLTEANGNVFVGGWEYGRKHGSFTLTGTFTEEDKGCCTICYEKEMSTAFYDCGHVVACNECAAKIDTCPVCRKRVLARLQIYGVKIVME